MNAFGHDAIHRHFSHKGLRHGDHSVELSQGAQLQPLVERRLPTHPARSVQCRHGRDAEASGDWRVDDVGTIGMSMDDVWREGSAQPSDLGSFPKVRASRKQHWMNMDAGIRERLKEGRLRSISVQHGRHVDVVAAAR